MRQHTENEGIPSNQHRIPPFWIRPADDRQRSVDPRVHEFARRLWPWAFRHAERELHDGPIAAETLVAVAIDVSARLQTAPEVGRNLNGYLITAFRHCVQSRRAREHRFHLEGLASELEKNHRLRSPDSTAVLEGRLMIDLLTTLLSHEVTHTLHLRMLGFSWKEVGSVLRISAKKAKSRYYYGLGKAHEELTKSHPRRLRSEASE